MSDKERDQYRELLYIGQSWALYLKERANPLEWWYPNIDAWLEEVKDVLMNSGPGHGDKGHAS